MRRQSQLTQFIANLHHEKGQYLTPHVTPRRGMIKQMPGSGLLRKQEPWN